MCGKTFCKKNFFCTFVEILVFVLRKMEKSWLVVWKSIGIRNEWKGKVVRELGCNANRVCEFPREDIRYGNASRRRPPAQTRWPTNAFPSRLPKRIALPSNNAGHVAGAHSAGLQHCRESRFICPRVIHEWRVRLLFHCLLTTKLCAT